MARDLRERRSGQANTVAERSHAVSGSNPVVRTVVRSMSSARKGALEGIAGLSLVRLGLPFLRAPLLVVPPAAAPGSRVAVVLVRPVLTPGAGAPFVLQGGWFLIGGSGKSPRQ